MRSLNIAVIQDNKELDAAIIRRIPAFLGKQRIPINFMYPVFNMDDSLSAKNLFPYNPDMLVMPSSGSIKRDFDLLKDIKERRPEITTVYASSNDEEMKAALDALSREDRIIDACWDKKYLSKVKKLEGNRVNSVIDDLGKIIRDNAFKPLSVTVIGGGCHGRMYAHLLKSLTKPFLSQRPIISKINVFSSIDDILEKTLELSKQDTRVDLYGLIEKILDVDCILLTTSASRLKDGGIAEKYDRSDLFEREARLIKGYFDDLNLIDHKIPGLVINGINPCGEGLLLLKKLGITAEHLTSIVNIDLVRQITYIESNIKSKSRKFITAAVESTVGVHGQTHILSGLDAKLFREAEAFASQVGGESAKTSIKYGIDYLQPQLAGISFFRDLARFSQHFQVNGINAPTYCSTKINGHEGFAILPARIDYGTKNIKIRADDEAIDRLDRNKVERKIINYIKRQEKQVKSYLEKTNLLNHIPLTGKYESS